MKTKIQPFFKIIGAKPIKTFIVTSRSRYAPAFEKPNSMEVNAISKSAAIRQAKREWEAQGADLRNTDCGGTIFKATEIKS